MQESTNACKKYSTTIMVDVKANNLFFVIMFWLGKYKMYTDNSRKEVE